VRERALFFNPLTDQEALFIDGLPIGFVYLELDGTIVFVNDYIVKNLNCEKETVVNKRWVDVFPGLVEGLLVEPVNPKVLHFQYKDLDFIAQRFPYNIGDNLGHVFIIQKGAELDKVTKEIDSYKELSMDLKAIFDISYDVIFVADANGNTIRVSTASKELWGYEEKELVGKSVYQLEKEGVFNPSITRLVLELGEKVTSIQKTKTGRRLMVIGTPIKDADGKIIRVVNASRDITEVSKLQKEIEELKQVTEGYKKELMQLREKNDEVQSVIYRSEKMRHILSLARKLGDVDSTVLLLGESGVGKEIISAYIHKNSHRKSKPFISINCGALPNQLLESELFGNENTKDIVEGRPGLFELANEGTLLLDEISELPLDFQTKLLRVLSEKKIVRIGGKEEVNVNVRIIATTNRNLEKEVKEGRFREDLYYRLNVIPIEIPPLRDRKEDILPLTLHFLKQLNQKYKLNRQLTSEVMDQLSQYSWPGNVRELQNIIERLLVTSDSMIIGSNQLPEQIRLGKVSESAIQVTKIIPLKDAVELVEKKLLEMAQRKYRSTTKMAEVLKVNQSTISRKMKKND
jgi:PAS domain S-box-containing protein